MTIGARGRLVAVAVAVAVFVVASARPAFAFCRFTTCASSNPPPGCTRDASGCYEGGIPLAWEEQCVSYSMSGVGSATLGIDHDQALELAQTGFNLWPLADCYGAPPSIALMSTAPISCERVAYYSTGPNQNAIVFRDQGWTHEGAAIALTSVMFNSRTGKILGADMEVNSEGFPYLTVNDLQYVFAHEAGHFLGLDHTPDWSALMFANYSLDATSSPVLGADDVAGICDIYPPTREVTACNFEPVRGFATDCGGNVVGSCAVAPPGRRGHPVAVATLAAVAALAWRSRRRRRRRSIF